MKTRQEKALEYAKEAWGIYFDDKHPDPAIEFTVGEITQSDYLDGYEQALKDSRSDELLKMLDSVVKMYIITDRPSVRLVLEAQQLIKEVDGRM